MNNQLLRNYYLNNSSVKKRIFMRAAIVLVLLTGFNPLAFADGTRYELAYIQADTTAPGADFEPKALLYKHIFPYNDNIELEGIIALGFTEEKITRRNSFASNFTQKLTLSNLLGVMVKFTGAMEPRVHAYLHAGLIRIDYDISTPAWVTNGANGSQSETGLAYGGGIKFSFLKRGAFVIELNVLPEVDTRNETFKTSTVSLGYQMPFN